MRTRHLLGAIGLASLALAPASAQPAATAPAAADAPHARTYATIDRMMRDWMLDARAPGMVWMVVAADGRVLHSGTSGVQDIESLTPVSRDTRFRIASMTKAFTGQSILRLADEGKLRLDDKAATHVPQMAGWAPTITVSDLLHHRAGFVTDDPWGDRQQSMPEAEFTALLTRGVPFTRAPGSAFEYSNFGYATLGRIVANASGRDYASHVLETILTPLGMRATTFEVRSVPARLLATGYRWDEGRWQAEPVMPHGAFGAMGGLVTTANDYARWVAHLLSGWPAPEPGSSEAGGRAVLRRMLDGGGLPIGQPRPGRTAAECRLATIYAAGLRVARDCTLGLVAFHGGGYPGYGSHMLLLPEQGIGIFAFANRTYGAPTAPVWDAALALKADGVGGLASPPPSPALLAAHAAAERIFETGRIDAVPGALAMNMLMDRPAARWAADLAQMKAEVGSCQAPEGTHRPVSTGALSGRFQWRCRTGRIDGQLLLAPTSTPQIQALRLSVVRP